MSTQSRVVDGGRERAGQRGIPVSPRGPMSSKCSRAARHIPRGTCRTEVSLEYSQQPRALQHWGTLTPRCRPANRHASRLIWRMPLRMSRWQMRCGAAWDASTALTSAVVGPRRTVAKGGTDGAVLTHSIASSTAAVPVFRTHIARALTQRCRSIGPIERLSANGTLWAVRQ